MGHSIQNNSIQASASAGVQATKSSAAGTANHLESKGESSDFSSALASVESEAELVEQPIDENSSAALAAGIAQNSSTTGNMLPVEEAEMWQALMLLQGENPEDDQAVLLQASMLLPSTQSEITKSVSPQLQNIALLDSKNKPLINPDTYRQDYFTLMSTQNKDAVNSLPAGFSTNNINMQLSGAQIMPNSNETLMANFAEQLAPIQATNSTLSQGLAAVGLGTATQAAFTQTQMAPINLGQNAWETNLGSRLQMMVGQNIQSAEIRLDPPELGALDIKIKVTNDVASVSISSAHAQVREALESAVPKLREMFAESGVALGDVNVRQESFAQQQSNQEEHSGFSGNTTGADNNEELQTVSRKIVSDSLLDIYA